MKIFIEIFVSPSDVALPRMYALSDGGSYGEAITATLLDFVAELPLDDVDFEALLERVEAGEYTAVDPLDADWSENDKLVWLLPPYASVSGLCISNENIEKYSVEGGVPQVFSVELFRDVRRKWREFIKGIDMQDRERWQGGKTEFDVNWP